MLVKKKNPSWYPSENKGLKVGETIEITDPKQLIVNGDVIGVSEEGIELSAFDMYGVLIKDELDEFKKFKEMKQQEALKTQLEVQKAELEAKLEEVKPAEPALVEETFGEKMAKARAAKKAEREASQ